MSNVSIIPLYRLDIDGQHIGTFTATQIAKLRTACDRACYSFRPHIRDPERAQIVIMSVASRYNLPPRQFLRTRRRPEYLVWPRFLVCQLLRDEGLSLQEIADIVYLSADHGSALNAIRRVADRAETDPRFRAELQAARKAVATAGDPQILLLPEPALKTLKAAAS